MEYSIEFRPSVLKSLKRFPKRDLVRIKKKIEELGQNLPEPNTTKMKGNNEFHRVRTGDYRIIYEIHGDRLVVLIVKVGHRKDIYQNLP
ncbi:type II toxin-antitoxin system RelE family toxin [Desulfoluna spongiiphila]|uniref:type II toxin-antitoxin system RelE family toxin n=1 Tax=Desulfoluna spongiiphila TaxID=419481 RepID=UPI001259CB1F|nr:type II toxin-antitoxin system RelE/ParE family toxin [Desulfoluna spongiiphila]VVS91081.1 toxin-antitoxin system rele/pare toxin family [Desulfoluna spongiiphila]